ncbi:YdcH family protein [Poseidonibacter antarcticus]|uniref:YdcH family protein n=1 Tax=Poseidonibacter antarcticus TaxID=2478538 RepID=UPI000EF45DF9|nr:YdcH family protein [Poseidonibacter antarcticus]
MFHEYRELIAELKEKDAHFHKLFDKHNDLDNEIAKLTQSNVDEAAIDIKKKEKLMLKDEVYNMIINYKNSK